MLGPMGGRGAYSALVTWAALFLFISLAHDSTASCRRFYGHSCLGGQSKRNEILKPESDEAIRRNQIDEYLQRLLEKLSPRKEIANQDTWLERDVADEKTIPLWHNKRQKELPAYNMQTHQALSYSDIDEK